MEYDGSTVVLSIRKYGSIPAQPLKNIFLDIGDNFPGFSRVFRDDGSAMEQV